MNNVEEFLAGISSIGIAGHLRPDGDAVGSVMALYLYVRENYPKVRADVYLDDPQPVFHHIPCFDEVITAKDDPDIVYDVFVTCDVSSPDRLSAGAEAFTRAKRTVCIDHHISNCGFADENHIRGEISSCCEVLYGLMDPDKIDLPVATALYTGMIHDTGVFQYRSVTPATMRTAAALIEKGVDFSRIIEDSFNSKSYIQNQVMGRVLAESIMLMNGRCIIGYLKRKDMVFYGISGQELDGIVSQLRVTQGVEVAVFCYEIDFQVYKISLRSRDRVDASRIACYFGGGGHKAAAGCEISGTLYDVINAVTGQIAVQLEELGIDLD